MGRAVRGARRVAGACASDARTDARRHPRRPENGAREAAENGPYGSSRYLMSIYGTAVAFGRAG